MTYTKPTMAAHARWELHAKLDELLGVIPRGHADDRMVDYAAYEVDYTYPGK